MPEMKTKIAFLIAFLAILFSVMVFVFSLFE